MIFTGSITAAGKGDIAVIRDIALSVWPQVYSEILSAEQIAYMMDMMYAPEVISDELDSGFYWFIIKSEDGEDTGYISVYFPEEKVCKLDKIYIKPQFRRTGAGRAAVKFISTFASSRGALKLILNVNKNNVAAQAAYKSYGFRHLRDETNDIGNNYVMDDFVLFLDI